MYYTVLYKSCHFKNAKVGIFFYLCITKTLIWNKIYSEKKCGTLPPKRVLSSD